MKKSLIPFAGGVAACVLSCELMLLLVVFFGVCALLLLDVTLPPVIRGTVVNTLLDHILFSAALPCFTASVICLTTILWLEDAYTDTISQKRRHFYLPWACGLAGGFCGVGGALYAVGKALGDDALMMILTHVCGWTALMWGILAVYIAAAVLAERLLRRRRVILNDTDDMDETDKEPMHSARWFKILFSLPYFAAVYGMIAWLMTP